MPELHRLFEYDTWANREVISHLRRIAVPPRALTILNHILGAEWLWLGRIHGDPKPAVVWPQLTLDECEAQTRVLLVEWIRTLHEEDLSRRVDYTNSQGERWSNTIEDILTHVVLHGTYHRGQIATIVRQSGETPAYTDYIHAVRQGLVD